jgi:O-methyltransferase involved in polyketide biosynthesis
VAEFDPNTPSIARVYDYVLGGKNNFAADRELADRLLVLIPKFAELAVENRGFLSRAVTWAANQGIGQFLDLGCGLPTAPNTHESAQAVRDDARVVYVDNDPAVVDHLQGLPTENDPWVRFFDGDVRDVDAVLDGARAGLDLSAPVCLVAGYLLHFCPADTGRDMMGRYAAALAPGSCLVLSVLQGDGEAADEGMKTYSARAAAVYNHPVPDVVSFFGPLKLVPPGLVAARHWDPASDLPQSPPQGNHVIGGVGRKAQISPPWS